MIDIGPIGGAYRYHFYLDNLGQVAGHAYISETQEVLPFVWSLQDGIEYLQNFGNIVGINDLGHVIGRITLESLRIWTEETGVIGVTEISGEGFLYWDNSGIAVGSKILKERENYAFYWSQETGRILIRNQEDYNIVPTDINDLGQVVGSSKTIFGEQHLFFWSLETGMVDMGIEGVPNDLIIDNLGQLAVEVESNVFFWSMDTGAIDIGSLGGNYASLFDMNDQGRDRS
jgi:probable HAF family extracellular repeat protein